MTRTKFQLMKTVFILVFCKAVISNKFHINYSRLEIIYFPYCIPTSRLLPSVALSTAITLEQGFLKFASLTPGVIEIRCWGYSTILKSEVQIRTQVLILRTWICFHPD